VGAFVWRGGCVFSSHSLLSLLLCLSLKLWLLRTLHGALRSGFVLLLGRAATFRCDIVISRWWRMTRFGTLGGSRLRNDHRLHFPTFLYVARAPASSVGSLCSILIAFSVTCLLRLLFLLRGRAQPPSSPHSYAGRRCSLYRWRLRPAATSPWADGTCRPPLNIPSPTCTVAAHGGPFFLRRRGRDKATAVRSAVGLFHWRHRWLHRTWVHTTAALEASRRSIRRGLAVSPGWFADVVGVRAVAVAAFNA